MTTLEILLLIALVIAIVCDIIRIVFWVRLGSGRSKENVKKHICTMVRIAEDDFSMDTHSGNYFWQYLEKNFDKYFD